MNIDQVKSGIKAHWADTPMADICIEIIDALERLPPQERTFLTYQSFSKFLKHKADTHLASAIAILTTSTYAILNAHGMFVDKQGNEYELSREEFQSALSDGVIAHPDTGEYIDNAKDHLLLYYSCNDAVFTGHGP